jgi:neutral ceramidase
MPSRVAKWYRIVPVLSSQFPGALQVLGESAILRLVVALLCALLLAPPVQFGFAETRLEVERPFPLGGYTERRDRMADPGGDPLWVRALTLTQGETKVTLVSAELLTIPGSLVEEVRCRLGDDRTLLVAATHTHSAPDSQMFNRRMTFKIPGIALFGERRLHEAAALIVDAIRRSEPRETLVTVEVRTGTARANRPRVEGGRPLEQVTSVRLAGERTSVTLLHYAAHPTILSERWNVTHGDWPGAWAGQRRRRMFFNGAMGDLSPVAESPREMAAMLDAAIESVEPLTVRDPQLSIARASLLPGAPRPHPNFAARNSLPEPLAEMLVQRFAPPRGEVTAVRLGNVALVGVPCELASMPGLRIMDAARRQGIEVPLVVSFANDWMGYVVTPEQYGAGEYEATLSFYGPGMAERVVSAAVQAVTAIAGTPEPRPALSITN